MSDKTKVILDLDAEISPYTVPHEIGHVLADTGHNEAECELMKGTWSQESTVTAEKRIYSDPSLVGSTNLGTTVGHVSERSTPQDD